MKYKIEEVKDKLGETVSLWHSDCLMQNKDVVSLYTKQMAWLLEKKWTMNGPQIDSNHKVIWAENSQSQIMGGVVYEYHLVNSQGWIVFIFVADEFSGRNIYGLLQRALEDETIRLGGTSIASQCHKDHTIRLKAGAREGMHPQYIRLYKDLSEEIEDRKKNMIAKTRKSWKLLTKETWNRIHGNTIKK